MTARISKYNNLLPFDSKTKSAISLSTQFGLNLVDALFQFSTLAQPSRARPQTHVARMASLACSHLQG
ncbi:MAG: hypothetical protein NVSMB49_21840 [Ktedonobacteraceae bacterium]